MDDLAITGVSGWGSLPIALSNADGTFSIDNGAVGDFATAASTAGVQALTGDYDGDGRGDVLLTGATGWRSFLIAHRR
ncbi:MAG: hypothetical protein CL927_05885 [Deltaproteobacteria bacterium]|nr:hypothetical protein [Deltaproteobacteria bacterium]